MNVQYKHVPPEQTILASRKQEIVITKGLCIQTPQNDCPFIHNLHRERKKKGITGFLQAKHQVAGIFTGQLSALRHRKIVR